MGRVWAGTGRDGVSVFNGKTWQTYDRLTGPLGCHVTALATSPLTGDVWGCTESGLFSYALRTKTWRYVTRADGLPSDQATCLAFTHTGTLIVGTDCDGIAIATLANNYKTWRVVPGPDAMPVTRRGRGMPSSLINCLLVGHDGTVYAGTTTGLARSEDGGDTWKFVRGDEWRDKVLGLYQGPQPVAATTDNVGVLEDWVTALAEDGAGHLYVGHRRRGLEVLDPDTGARVDDAKSAYGGFVDVLLPTASGRVFIGTYGDGLTQTAWPAPDMTVTASKPPAALPPLPLVSKPPTSASLASLLRQVQAQQGTLPVGGAAYLGEDWATQGDWVGRYGRQYARLCAMQAPWGDHVPFFYYTYTVKSVLGPHHKEHEAVRSWISWLKGDDPRALYDPVVGYRRQAENDDRGEDYSPFYDGPDLWYKVGVPVGVHRLSLYVVNKDGHDGDNRFRDYTVEVKPDAGSVEGAQAAPALSHARVHAFWGGVYKSFLLRGPATYYLKIGKNNSMNTLCSGLFLDTLVGDLGPFQDMGGTWMGTVAYAPSPAPAARGRR